MRLLRTKAALRIAVGATAAVAILLPTLAASLAPALQPAAILVGGAAAVALFIVLMRADPPP